MKHLLLSLLLLTLTALAALGQTFRYITAEEGLSSRRVYAIERDDKGYMWFLTHDGMDRFDGAEVVNYQLSGDSEEVSLSHMMELSQMLGDSQGGIWVVTQEGALYRFDRQRDRFVRRYQLPLTLMDEGSLPLCQGAIDRYDRVWLFTATHIVRYDTATGEAAPQPNPFHAQIIDFIQVNDSLYLAATAQGIQRLDLRGGKLSLRDHHTDEKAADHREESPSLTSGAASSANPGTAGMPSQITALYYHTPNATVYVGTNQQGLYAYNPDNGALSHIEGEVGRYNINTLTGWDEQTLLIATDGGGVYHLNTTSGVIHTLMKSDFKQANMLRGNTVRDLYADEKRRLWLANYPIGIAMVDLKQPPVGWWKQSVGNPQSLVNDQVNSIMEDSEGDIWMATNQGVSLYRKATGRWQSFLNEGRTQTLLTLCEVEPGIVWTTGLGPGLHEINKRTGQVSYFTPQSWSGEAIPTDKYIRAIYRDPDGLIWSGGLFNLKQVDRMRRSIRLIPHLTGISAITPCNADSLWIGCTQGLFQLDKRSGQHRRISLPEEPFYIYDLCQAPDGTLYIATNSAGLIIYSPQTGHIERWHKDNCALISNSIYTLLCDHGSQLLIATEGAVTRFDPKTRRFTNWTREQGLATEHFNAASGALTRTGEVLMGSTEGVLVFERHRLEREASLASQRLTEHSTQMVLSDLTIFYQQMNVGDKGSPLTCELDLSPTLTLRHNQNFFSLKVSTIDYDSPSQVLYSWRLEGFNDRWSEPNRNGRIRITNLAPGHYTLRIRALSNADRSQVLQERTLQIVLTPPFWRTNWAYAIYLLLLLTLLILGLRYHYLKRQRKISREKINFFIHTAHDIRTPLTLVQAPLEEMKSHEPLSDEGQRQLALALKNIHVLVQLVSDLMHFERIESYKEPLNVVPTSLNRYLTEVADYFRPIAEMRHITLLLTAPEAEKKVWMDRHKMDSIVRNLLSNALKYTPEGGRVELKATLDVRHWQLTVSDTGIGIPAREQRRLFHLYYRATNAINAKITGSGIGLLMVKRLVKRHQGKLALISAEGQGTTVNLTFPLAAKAYGKGVKAAETIPQNETAAAVNPTTHVYSSNGEATGRSAEVTTLHQASILVVEDNDELRRYLTEALSANYRVTASRNGREALQRIEQEQPDVVVTDVMMPELRGDDLCRQLKGSLATSHIPVILLTALAEEQEVIKGLHCGADDYLTKPFHIGVLRASIERLLTNRERLKRWFSQAANQQEQPAEAEALSTLDSKFMSEMKEQVERHMADKEFNVDSLCRQMGLSRTSLYNKVKALTDESPADYMRLIRLQKAAEMLKTGRQTVAEVAERTGFNDAKYFREVFKRYYHTSPTQFAKQDNDAST